MSAYFSGALVESWGTRGVFAATAVFPLLVCGAAVLIDEARVGVKDNDGSAAGAGAVPRHPDAKFQPECQGMNPESGLVPDHDPPRHAVQAVLRRNPT